MPRYDLFDFFSPRVYVISDAQYAEAKRKRLEEDRDSLKLRIKRYKEALNDVESELEELDR